MNRFHTSTLTCFAASLLLVSTAALAGPLFGPPANFTVGASPYEVVLADFNGDGNLDMVVAQTESWLTLMLGAGDGTFGSATTLPIPSTVSSGVAAADFNGDGNLDLVNVNNVANSVSVRLGVGSGTFGAPTNYGTGAWPMQVAAGDLNNDGWPDIAVSNANGGSVSVLLGTGGGAFGALNVYGTGWTPEDVTIADVNADGKADLVTSNYASNTVSVLLGSGNGTFPTHVEYVSAPRPFETAIADLNGDGTLDLAVAGDDYYGGTGTVSVLFGNGNGTFGARTDYLTGLNPRFVAIRDVDMDGRLDLVSANYGYSGPGNTVSVLLGSGGGAFGRRVDYICGLHPGSVAIGDLNGDGRPDLVTANTGSTTASVLLNQPVPRIAAIRDVVNDQGGKVKVMWDASRRDLSPYYDIDSYWILRSAPAAAAARAAQAGSRAALDPSLRCEPQVGAIQALQVNGATYYWEYVASQPAFHTANYSFVASTTCDSLASSNPRTAFMIMARTAGGTQWWFSDPDSGYSVDNLAPPAPAPLTGTYAGGTTTLRWAPSTAPDLATYRLYRGVVADFVPGPDNLVGSSVDTTFADAAGAPRYYRVSAVDAHGNEGPSTLLTPAMTTDVPGGIEVAFGLGGIRPNPVRGGRFEVAFTLSSSTAAQLELLDVGGRRIVARELSAFGPGTHTIEFAAGHRLAPGLYLLRLRQGANVRVQRVVVLD